MKSRENALRLRLFLVDNRVHALKMEVAKSVVIGTDV